MTRAGWQLVVNTAVQQADAGDVSSLDLLVSLLVEQDHAKNALRESGYGCIGMPWADVVDEVLAGSRERDTDDVNG